MIKGYELIEKMYSDYDEYEDTRLYSTGDSDLDNLLERAFCEGYEYAQREFGNKENKKANRQWALEEEIEGTKASKKLKKLDEQQPGAFEFGRKRKLKEEKEKLSGYLQSIREEGGKDSKQAELLRQRRSRNKPAEQLTLQERLENLDPQKKKELKKRVNARMIEKEAANLRRKEELDRQKAAEDRASFLRNDAEDRSNRQLTVTSKQEKNGSYAKKISNTAKKIWNGENGLGKVGNRAAIIGTGAALVGGGIGIAIHKHNKKKRAEKEKQEEEK